MITDKRLAVLWEFNCVLSVRDKTSIRKFRDESTALLLEIINIGLVDVGEFLEGGRAVQFTHFQKVSHSRLDRVCVVRPN